MSFRAGFSSPIDLMEQEVEHILLSLEPPLVCPYCESPLSKHSNELGVYWFCDNRSHKAVEFRHNLDGHLPCPSCSASMVPKLSRNELSMRSLKWDCLTCGQSVVVKLCVNCFTLLKKQKPSFKNFPGLADNDWYYCDTCGEVYKADDE